MEKLNYFLMYVQMLILVLSILAGVAFFTLMERKILSYIHFRKGPNKVLISGLFQPIADAIKLYSKNDFPVLWSNKIIYYVSPIFMFLISLISWWPFPVVWSIFSSKYSIIYIILILGLTVYGVLISGWSSNSKYAIIGSMRSVAQSISYEVIMSFIITSFMVTISSYTLMSFYHYCYLNFTLMSPLLLIFFIITLLSELGRSPFDLAEGESELVSGYSVEYGGIMYVLIFLSENTMTFFSSFILTFLFACKFNLFLSFFVFSTILMILIVIRGIVPRIRYDQVMILCWIWMLPITLVLFNLAIMMKYF